MKIKNEKEFTDLYSAYSEYPDQLTKEWLCSLIDYLYARNLQLTGKIHEKIVVYQKQCDNIDIIEEYTSCDILEELESLLEK